MISFSSASYGEAFFNPKTLSELKRRGNGYKITTSIFLMITIHSVYYSIGLCEK